MVGAEGHDGDGLDVPSYYGAYWTGHLLIGVGAPHWYARRVHLIVSVCGARSLGHYH
ncbi:hypothetical protein [Nonomuraea sp. SBT364]|uniref:hypothetical protein n=1 Tax=Nonomuraea sp. SBT364 TaxID=1580530 RepID=UPI000AA37D42|nr:hypothetical protein [Nonomuraea sp. SBT364]